MNTYLWSEKLQSTQLEKLLLSLSEDTWHYPPGYSIWTHWQRGQSRGPQYHDEWDGMIKLQKSLEIYRKGKDGRTLNQSDSLRKLWEKEITKN